MTRNSIRLKAHRVSFAIAQGIEVSDITGEVIHSCDNPPCCNPRHLREATHLENMLDAAQRGRMGRNHQPAGEDSPNAKLNEEKVRIILSSDDMGITLAERFGVSPTLISYIRKRKGWKHVK